MHRALEGAGLMRVRPSGDREGREAALQAYPGRLRSIAGLYAARLVVETGPLSLRPRAVPRRVALLRATPPRDAILGAIDGW